MNKSMIGLLLAVSSVHANTTVPPPGQSEPIVIRGATIHTVSGAAVADGEVLIADGRIVEVRARGADGELPAGFDDAVTLDLDGLHVYPGLISANTVLGLVRRHGRTRRCNHW